MPPATHCMSTAKNLEIEALRAVAVLMTAFSHLPHLLPFQKDTLNTAFFSFMPWTGVDLFFCISGYVVSRSFVDLLDRNKANGTFWLAAQSFWIRRIYRLIPSAWLWVVIGIICAVSFNSTGVFASLHDNLRSATAVITFTGNLANPYGKLLEPNSVYWSLALEEQFYLLFPLFLLVTSGAWRWRILLLLILIQLPIDRNPFGGPLAQLFTSFRLDALMWGILIFMFSRSAQYRLFEPVFLQGQGFKILLLNLFLVYLLGAIAAHLIGMPTAVGLIAIIAAVLVWLASYEAGYICRIPGLMPVLVWLGARSYAIYLIHMLAYRFCLEAWTRHAIASGHPLDSTDTLRMLVSAIVLTLLLAELNFRLIEEPLRRRGAAIAARRLATAQSQS
jgi:peptidoglycan/LPS O-acetylase OafA/YrhL